MKKLLVVSLARHFWNSGCRYGQMVYKRRSHFDARSPRSGKEIKARAYIRGYTGGEPELADTVYYVTDE